MLTAGCWLFCTVAVYCSEISGGYWPHFWVFWVFWGGGINPYLPTEHRGTIGTFDRIPEYIIADFPMVAKLSPRTIGRSPRVNSPLKSTQNFGL